MNCPVCTNVQLVMSERHGIEIDYCPQCRGIWLDRGELDKIIERSTSETSQNQSRAREDYHYDRHHDHSHHDKHGRDHYYKRSFLLDLFD